MMTTKKKTNVDRIKRAIESRTQKSIRPPSIKVVTVGTAGTVGTVVSYVPFSDRFCLIRHPYSVDWHIGKSRPSRPCRPWQAMQKLHMWTFEAKRS